jgi:lysophospholipid acyltransferase (LPLAT)-like uncharacterized protein
VFEKGRMSYEAGLIYDLRFTIYELVVGPRTRVVMNPPAQNAMRSKRKPRTSGVIIPHVPRWYQRVWAWLIALLVRAVSATLRYRFLDRSGYFTSPAPGPTIYCIWHNRLALSMAAYYKYLKKHNPTSGLAAMVSASKDGGFLAAILESFAVQPVRGSSSRRGPQALLELTTWSERGYDLALTPDGPRGPRYEVQEGVMSLAQVTGLPIIPCSWNLGWKLQIKSWDGFQIPLPFSRCEMIFEKPIRISRDASDAERETLRIQLQTTLRAISKD